MKILIAKIKVALVDIAARHSFIPIAGKCRMCKFQGYAASVRNREQQVVIAVDKADMLLFIIVPHHNRTPV